MDHDENLERCKLILTGMDDDALRIAGRPFFKINWRFADSRRRRPEKMEYLNCLQENRLKVNSEREQDSPVEMEASNISRFKEMPFLKAKRHRAHSIVSGVRVKANGKYKKLSNSFSPTLSPLKMATVELSSEGNGLVAAAQQPMRTKAFSAHLSIRDHWVLRCMNRCPDQVIILKRDPQCLSPEFKRFKDGRQDVEDDSRPGRPSTSKTDENVEKVACLIRSDRRLSIRAIAETVNINKECVRQILHDNLNMQKVCAKMVLKILTFEQQATRKNVSTDILDVIKNDPNLLKKVITCDESWFFTYDPETKCQSMHWKTPTSPRAKKARMSKSKFKAMMIVSFDIHGIVYLHWVPEGQTINQHYYLEVLGNLRERIRKNRPEMWKEKSWIFHQDNAPAHSTLSVKRFLAKHSIPMLEHPPYSPDLTPCDFYLFPKVKSTLKEIRLESAEAVKEKAAGVLKELTKDDFQHCFQQWKIRTKRCRDREGVYIEGDNK
ncbi:mariner Mos1 transposase [Trichonephila clavipes]|nr:mariner Mos1 transposase [Trichonephila clavipes]